jgi:uncharacterized Rmd1/YagE family protein
VCWGTATSDHSTLEAFLRFHSTGNVIPQREEMFFEMADESGLDPDKDIIRLSNKSNPVQQLSEKIAISIALSRSVKLDDIELDVERAVAKAQALDFANAVRKGGREGDIKGAESRAELAYLNHLRYKLTVRSRLKEDPAYFWDKPSSLYKIYKEVDEYLDIDDRVENVGEKIELPTSYWHLENQHSSELISWRLEKMIILIIALELVLAILSKSQMWRELTFEDLVDSLMVRFGMKSAKLSNLGDEYEIVEEVYEIIDDSKSSPRRRVVHQARNESDH